MKATLTQFLGTLAISFGLTAAAWSQQPLPQPQPLPPPTEGPPPNLSAPPGIPQGGITVSPGSIGSGASCTPTPIISGGCIDACLPHCGFGGTWIAGGGIYYMAPVYNNNRAFLTTTTATNAASSTNFNSKLSIAPLAFVGYSFDNGFGIRFRWFQIRQDESAGATLNGTTSVADAAGNPLTFAPAGKGASVIASSHLYLSAYDLEATYTANMGKWFFIGSAGARYAQINQGYQAVATDPTVPTSAISSANHNFDGFGPTLALEGHRQIWDSCCLGCFGVYASARASILFGSGNLSSGLASVSPVAIAPTANFPVAPTSSSTSGSQVSVIPVGEMEFGGEWTYAWGRLRFFAQVGVVGQIWWGTGNASDPTIGSSGSPSNLGFIGAVGRAGVTY